MIFAESGLGIYSPEPLEANDFNGIRIALDEVGVCVIRNILTPEQQQQFLTSFWDALEARKSALSRSDSSTWTAENTDWYGTVGAGQYKHYGMAQEAHCWIIRQNPKIRAVFEQGVYGHPSCTEYSAVEEWQPEECCVSLDGSAAMFRPAVSGLQLHVDLVPGLEGFEYGSVQCAYNLYPVEISPDGSRATAGFVCVPGSHKLYDEMWAARQQEPTFKQPTKHWHLLESDSPMQSQAVLVTSPANCLVLWRSDLQHKNYGGDFDPDDLTPLPGLVNSPRLARLTMFVTFMPKKFRSEKARQSKIRSVLAGCSNNHWAALATRLPIVPFPAWVSEAKTTRRVIPVFSPDLDESPPAEAEEKKTERVTKRQRTSNGRGKSKAGASPLPQAIMDLL